MDLSFTFVHNPTLNKDELSSHGASVLYGNDIPNTESARSNVALGPNRSNTSMSAVVKVAAKYNPPPQATPTAADNQTAEAVFNPFTVRVVMPVLLCMSWIINPAPRKPTPEGTDADTRA